jgi:cytochrome b involved in lipid metabolism
MRKIYLSLSLVIVSLSLVGCSLLSKNNNTPAPAETPVAKVVPATNTVQTQTAKTYTMNEIAKHATAEDCWLLIDGQVYDVTSFIASGKHAGGEAIITGCGIDATKLFNTRPMGSGTPHSDKARSFLPSFYIGDLQL